MQAQTLAQDATAAEPTGRSNAHNHDLNSQEAGQETQRRSGRAAARLKPLKEHVRAPRQRCTLQTEKQHRQQQRGVVWPPSVQFEPTAAPQLPALGHTRDLPRLSTG